MSGTPDVGIGIMGRSATSQSVVVVKTASKDVCDRLLHTRVALQTKFSEDVATGQAFITVQAEQIKKLLLT